MKGLYAAVWSECLKMIRSKVFWITFVFFAFIPLLLGFMNFILRYPELADKLGLIGDKAKIAGTADWASYINMLGKVMMGVGTLGFTFVASWVFGREYTDRTVKDLLALPVSRDKNCFI